MHYTESLSQWLDISSSQHVNLYNIWRTFKFTNNDLFRIVFFFNLMTQII